MFQNDSTRYLAIFQRIFCGFETVSDVQKRSKILKNSLDDQGIQSVSVKM